MRIEVKTGRGRETVGPPGGPTVKVPTSFTIDVTDNPPTTCGSRPPGTTTNDASPSAKRRSPPPTTTNPCGWPRSSVSLLVTSRIGRWNKRCLVIEAGKAWSPTIPTTTPSASIRSSICCRSGVPCRSERSWRARRRLAPRRLRRAAGPGGRHRQAGRDQSCDRSAGTLRSTTSRNMRSRPAAPAPSSSATAAGPESR